MKRDAVLAIGVAATLAVVVSAEQGGRNGPGAYVWAVALGALMLRRRSYPRLVLALTVFGLFAYYTAGYPAIGVAVPVAAALFSAAEAGHRRSAVTAAVVALGVSSAFRILDGQSERYVLLYDLVGHLALAVAAIALGELVRARHRLHELAEHQIALAAEHRLTAHKQGLSRELHDSIGHTLTVAAIHAGVARQENHRDPATASQALDQVTTSISAALTALRTAVRQLHTTPPTNTTAGPPHTSLPTRADIEALADTARAAGYHVRTRLGQVDGPAAAVAFRVIREAVTNTLRHSPSRSIDITLQQDQNHVAVRIDDGTGLDALTTELAALGGTLTAAATPGGWRVEATIPHHDTPAEPAAGARATASTRHRQPTRPCSNGDNRDGQERQDHLEDRDHHDPQERREGRDGEEPRDGGSRRAG
ncbi:histidine kinase [Actinoplanes sp. NPDC049596]|uniref:sensor histidine kinase n=1 Tax=unclassified Actinoplanes TaxID=2626549 RepID=UPI003440B7DB